MVRTAIWSCLLAYNLNRIALEAYRSLINRSAKRERIRGCVHRPRPTLEKRKTKATSHKASFAFVSALAGQNFGGIGRRRSKMRSHKYWAATHVSKDRCAVRNRLKSDKVLACGMHAGAWVFRKQASPRLTDSIFRMPIDIDEITVKRWRGAETAETRIKRTTKRTLLHRLQSGCG